jgi:cell division septal protein FtsQ
MRSGTGLLILVGATVIVALAVTHVPEFLDESEVFRVTGVELDGARYLTEDDARTTAAIPPEMNIWESTDPVAERLRHHPLVQEVRVRRRLPGTLILEVSEREPVAFLPTPALVPVDRNGSRLPVDPTLHLLDLPLLSAAQEQMDRTLTPGEIRLLASELHRLERLDPLVHGSVSDAALGSWGEVVLRLSEPRVDVRYQAPMTPTRLREGLLVLADALQRHPDRAPRVLDLRFADQVVVSFNPHGAR